MKKDQTVKNIILITISVIVIVGCGYLLFTRLSGKSYKPETPTSVAGEEVVDEITGEVYKEEEKDGEKTGKYEQTEMRKTLEKIRLFVDHGLPQMDNIGRDNPFEDTE